MTLFRCIVVGLDGSPRADAALGLALSLRDPHGRLVLAAVVHGAKARAGAMQRLERAVAALPADVPAEVEVLEASSAAPALALLASARDADLIVVGSTHRGEAGRRTGRTTVQRLLHAAPCAVAAASDARPGTLERPRVLVAFDGSPEAHAAAHVAFAIAGAAAGSVRVCRVLEPAAVETRDGRLPESVAGAAGKARAAIAAMAAVVERAPRGVAAEHRLLAGAPAGRLLEESLDVDMLVLGSRQQGAVRRAVSGSVSSALLGQATVPVLVTPRHALERLGAQRETVPV